MPWLTKSSLLKIGLPVFLVGVGTYYGSVFVFLAVFAAEAEALLPVGYVLRAVAWVSGVPFVFPLLSGSISPIPILSGELPIASLGYALNAVLWAAAVPRLRSYFSRRRQ